MKQQSVQGKGSDLTDKKLLLNRGKKKMITRGIIKALLKIAQKKGNKRFIKSLSTAYHCGDKITTGNGRMYTKYCRGRICTVCEGNRKALLIKKYYPIIKTWKEPYFVTLTVKSVTARNLNKWISEGMIRGIQRILDKHDKRNLRGNGIKLMGIRTLECNFNSIKSTYNPHFHIIVSGKDAAELLINEWLNLWKSDKQIFTNRKAQDMRPIESLERDMIETIKYGTKIFTQPDPNNKKKKKGSERIYAVALYNILNAMKRKHLIEHFGFKLPTSSTNEKTEPTLLTDSKDWKYDANECDWLDVFTDTMLTNFEPSPELLKIMNDIDLEKE